MNADCLAEATVLAFIGGTLPPDERPSVEEHIAACSACADLVTWAAADQGSAVRLPGAEGRPFVGQLEPGARVGRYQILGAVGRGGMGEVYAAYHPDLDRRIAVKVVYGADGATDHRRVRLLREARAIARLSHPNVITVHDAGTFGGGVFIAMELIDGWTIEQWLRAETRTWQEILDIFVAAARGLAAAHAAGVIHRDFKPQNVMIARDGSVRVMDFGLARLARADADDDSDAIVGVRMTPTGSLTKTGAFVGTPAYMSPEQFRREATDSRSDQFSFCVALHEALFGSRPAAAPPNDDLRTRESSAPARRAGVPGWLRAIVLRGASAAREQRYPSMNDLVAALERGRTRVRRQLSLAAVGLAVVVVTAGAWRVAHGSRFACAVPQDRIAAVWAAGDAGDPRRQSIHRAFAATGRATAETSWTRLSRVLDDYVTAWSAMYLQTCEATHVRGEQSAEVHDMRMSCLNDNLDQVRALGDALATADATAMSHAVAAAQDLTPVSRCAEVALLKSAVPLPKDERTLREVLRLRKAVRELQARIDIGDFAGVLKRSQALRPEVEATGYKPLLAELLSHLAIAKAGIDPDPSESEATLREAMVLAEASRDDLSAATVAAEMVYVIGYRLGRVKEAEFWTQLGHAILDRMGGDQARVRSWLDGSLGGAFARVGDFETARVVMERSVLLKERSVGKQHPDYATSLGDIAYVLTRGGHHAEALAAATEGIQIFLEHGDPDALNLGLTYANQGEAYAALGKYPEAETAFQNALQNLSKNVGTTHPETAFALHGLGETKLATGAPERAVQFFEDAMHIRQQPHGDPLLAAESEFGLARALWESRSDRKRARSLATTAVKTYRDEHRPQQERVVGEWLADHRLRN